MAEVTARWRFRPGREAYLHGGYLRQSAFDRRDRGRLIQVLLNLGARDQIQCRGRIGVADRASL